MDERDSQPGSLPFWTRGWEDEPFLAAPKPVTATPDDTTQSMARVIGRWFVAAGMAVLIASVIGAWVVTQFIPGSQHVSVLDAPTVQPSGFNYCDGVTRDERINIERAAVEMRRTVRSTGLLSVLAAETDCLAVRSLPYHGAITKPYRDGDHQGIVIVLSADFVLRLPPDELASVLIHEATHVERIVSGRSCEVSADCHQLPNGVMIEEEVAAHAEQARFWLAIHGVNGVGEGNWQGGGSIAPMLDFQLEMYLYGPDEFRAYVIRTRSSQHESLEIDPPGDRGMRVTISALLSRSWLRWIDTAPTMGSTPGMSHELSIGVSRKQ